jgi:hypothetical protein
MLGEKKKKQQLLYINNKRWRLCLVHLKKLKKIQDFPSSRILCHMHGVLNIDENKN